MEKPFVDWAELRRQNTLPVEQRGKLAQQLARTGYGAWDKQADIYALMAQMEGPYTQMQLNCIPWEPADTVLDVGCGSGRMAIPAAMRARSVLGIDTSGKMMEYARQEQQRAGLTNLELELLDWTEAGAAERLGRHDIVMWGRVGDFGPAEILRLSSLARKYVLTVHWSFGELDVSGIIAQLFEGIPPVYQRPSPWVREDRRLGNNSLYNMVYDLGYEPSMQIMTDGFIRQYPDREAAYTDLRRLRPRLKDEDEPIFRRNVDRYLTQRPDGTVEYRSETKAVVLWWPVDGNGK